MSVHSRGNQPGAATASRRGFPAFAAAANVRVVIGQPPETIAQASAGVCNEAYMAENNRKYIVRCCLVIHQQYICLDI